MHHIRDVTFAEDANRTTTGNAPAVMAVLRDIVRGAFHLAGWTNTARARRAHTTPATAVNPLRHPMIIPDKPRNTPGPWEPCRSMGDYPDNGSSKIFVAVDRSL